MKRLPLTAAEATEKSNPAMSPEDVSKLKDTLQKAKTARKTVEKAERLQFLKRPAPKPKGRPSAKSGPSSGSGKAAKAKPKTKAKEDRSDEEEPEETNSLDSEETVSASEPETICLGDEVPPLPEPKKKKEHPSKPSKVPKDVQKEKKMVPKSENKIEAKSSKVSDNTEKAPQKDKKNVKHDKKVKESGGNPEANKEKKVSAAAESTTTRRAQSNKGNDEALEEVDKSKAALKRKEEAKDRKDVKKTEDQSAVCKRSLRRKGTELEKAVASKPSGSKKASQV